MKPHVKYGLHLGLICSVLAVCKTYIDAAGVTGILSWATYAAICIILYIAMKEKRAQQGGRLTYSEGLGTGMLAALTGAAITAVAFYINLKFFNRAFVETIREFTRERMEERFSEEEMEGMMDLMTGPGVLSFVPLLEILVVGFIASLIIAAILKQGENNPMRNDGEGMAN